MPLEKRTEQKSCAFAGPGTTCQVPLLGTGRVRERSQEGWEMGEEVPLRLFVFKPKVRGAGGRQEGRVFIFARSKREQSLKVAFSPSAPILLNVCLFLSRPWAYAHRLLGYFLPLVRPKQTLVPHPDSRARQFCLPPLEKSDAIRREAKKTDNFLSLPSLP